MGRSKTGSAQGKKGDGLGPAKVGAHVQYVIRIGNIELEEEEKWPIPSALCRLV
jgi:hypothetical protein